jgi:hypothetical protein
MSETCRVSFQNKSEKLVSLVGFVVRNMYSMFKDKLQNCPLANFNKYLHNDTLFNKYLHNDTIYNKYLKIDTFFNKYLNNDTIFNKYLHNDTIFNKYLHSDTSKTEVTINKY